MVVTTKFLNKVEENNRIEIPKELRNYMIEKFGTEPSFNVSFTEQDIHENIKKIIRDYSNGNLKISAK